MAKGGTDMVEPEGEEIDLPNTIREEKGRHPSMGCFKELLKTP